MKSRLVLLLVFLFAMFTVNASADTFEIPNSEISVQVDGLLDEIEWVDARHVQFTAVNGELIDVRVKYDVNEGSLVFGVTVPDSSFAVYDRFFIYVDNDDDIELNPQPDDFLIGLSRDTEYTGNYKRDFEFYHVVGTGSEWDINNLLFDSRFLTAPFGRLDWARAETSAGWEFEMKMSLDRDPVHSLGLVFKQNDMDEGVASLVYYPQDQPGTTNYPTNWDHAVIPSYSPPEPETTEDNPELETTEHETSEPEITNEISGYPYLSIVFGLSLIVLINKKLIYNTNI